MMAKNRKQKLAWRDEDIAYVLLSLFPEPNYSKYRNLSPAELFEQIFDDKVITLLKSESTRYAAFKNWEDPNVSSEEIKVFAAILYLSGYNDVPSKRLYWESRDDLRNKLVLNAMRRDRFKTIMRTLHFADNTHINPEDKMWKLRPLMNLLKIKYLELFEPEEQLDFDECMVAYYGRHRCKQSIRGKPIRFGYKVWSLNTPDGYLINFDIYQGKNPNGVTAYEVAFGKATAPLVQMLDEFPPDKSHLPYKLYFDNLFTSISLLTQLKKRGYSGTGTMRENRIPKECSFTPSAIMKKKARGSYEKRSSAEEDIVIVRWADNTLVTAGSTCHGVEPIASVSRYSKSEKKKVQVPQPNLIRNYNKYMGGTDRMDENISYYRIGIRGKKWWWPLFTWMLDTMMHNAWILMRKAGTDISQLEFRRHIVCTYLEKYKNCPVGAGRPSLSRFSALNSQICDDIRLDGINHLVAVCNRRRCLAPGCSRTVRTQCVKCNVGLCVTCFVSFHTQ